jgi:hypothetical protein
LDSNLAGYGLLRLLPHPLRQLLLWFLVLFRQMDPPSELSLKNHIKCSNLLRLKSYLQAPHQIQAPLNARLLQPMLPLSSHLEPANRRLLFLLHPSVSVAVRLSSCVKSVRVKIVLQQFHPVWH